MTLGQRIPAGLVVFRALAGLALPALALVGGPVWLSAGLLALGVLSDIFDGIIARRLGCATEGLRTWDSRVDVVFWVGAVTGLHLMHPNLWPATWPVIATILALEAGNHALSYAKFRREASPHHYLSKAFGLVLWATLTQLYLTGAAGPMLAVALAVGVASQLEAAAITLRLRAWRCDVPTVWRAGP